MSSSKCVVAGLCLACSVICFAKEISAQEKLPAIEQRLEIYEEVHGIGLLMHIFQPPEIQRNGLGVVDVISGSWDSSRGKLRDHERAQVFERLCRRGYTVFAIRPGSVSKFTIDEMVQHLEKGVRWVKQQHAVYGIDPQRLGLMGASAGGHLASLLAVRNGRASSHPPREDVGVEDASVKAVAVFFPPTDLMEFAGGPVDLNSEVGIAPILRVALVGQRSDLSAEQIATLQEAASPARRVTDDTPPFLVIHGTADFLVPIEQSEKLVAALKDKGIEVEFVKKTGGGHPWPTIYEEVELFADWFDRHLKED